MNTANAIEIEPTPRLWTRKEYYKMADAGIFRPGERVELIGGRIVTMSPQNSPHFTAIRLAEDALRKVFGLGYEVRVQGPLDLSPSSQPEPDIAVVRGSIRDYAKAHPTTAVLVVEVSDSTVVFDRGEKASLYASVECPNTGSSICKTDVSKSLATPCRWQASRMAMAIASTLNLPQTTRLRFSPSHKSLFRSRICCPKKMTSTFQVDKSPRSNGKICEFHVPG